MLRIVLFSLILSASLPAATPVLPHPEILAVTVAASGGAAIDPEIMKTGRQQFMVCGACHGQSGEGTAAGPPIAGSEWVTGPEENLIRIQLRGLRGPIQVKGQEYNFPAGMAPMAYQTDDQVAAVLTYIRNSFGNMAPPVLPATVAALRGEVGKPQVTAAELIPPVPPAPPVEKAGETSDAPAKPSAGKYDQLLPSSSLPKWLAAGGLLVFLVILGVALRKR
jgi:mono/diheme cytochrome c family protein